MAGNQEDSNTERELLELLRNNPQAGYTRLFEMYFGQVCKHVYRYIPNERIAQDVAQDLFVELWTKRDKLNITSSAGAYLHRMAASRALNYIRDNKKHSHADVSEVPGITARQPSPDDIIDAKGMDAMITSTIDGLPLRCRQVFMLSRFEHMTNTEIAEGLDISVKTVENQMTKALRTLRDAIEKYKASE